MSDTPSSPTASSTTWPVELSGDPSLFAPFAISDPTLRASGTASALARLDRAESLFPALAASAAESPYSDVRSAVSSFLRSVGRNSLADRVDTPLSPSYFIPISSFFHLHLLETSGGPSSAPSPSSSGGRRGDSVGSRHESGEYQEEVLAAIRRCYVLQNARVLNVYRALAWHPRYLASFLDTTHNVMDEDGPLLLPWRHYVAIMASARHNCEYLMRREQAKFLVTGGDPAWLAGGFAGSETPRKLTNLDELNARMAHQPWTITQDHIRALVRGEHSWSLNELVHAILILSTFHSLSTLVLSLGISRECDITDDVLLFPAMPGVTPADDISAGDVAGASAGAGSGKPTDGGDGGPTAAAAAAAAAAASSDDAAAAAVAVAVADLTVADGGGDDDGGSQTSGGLRSGRGSMDGDGGDGGGGAGAGAALPSAFASASGPGSGPGSGSGVMTDGHTSPTVDTPSTLPSSSSALAPSPAISAGTDAATPTGGASTASTSTTPTAASTATLPTPTASSPTATAATGPSSSSSGGGSEEASKAAAAAAAGSGGGGGGSGKRNAMDEIESDEAFKQRLLAGLLTGDSDEDDEGEDDDEGFEDAGVGAAAVVLPTPDHKPRGRVTYTGMNLLYSDFDTSEGVFRTQDFSWEDHGYSMVAKYFDSAADRLENLYSLAASLTYNDLGQDEAEADTQPFREAIWYYVHRMFGICHDDYDYHRVNHFVNRRVKTFVKQAVCSPESLGPDEFEAFSSVLRPDEKCHVLILANEARKQAEMLYALHALMDHVMGP